MPIRIEEEVAKILKATVKDPIDPDLLIEAGVVEEAEKRITKLKKTIRSAWENPEVWHKLIR